jgi:hypothetical protein
MVGPDSAEAVPTHWDQWTRRPDPFGNEEATMVHSLHKEGSFRRPTFYEQVHQVEGDARAVSARGVAMGG